MMCDSAPNYLRFRIFLLFGSQHVKGRAISNPDYSTSFVCIWSPAPSHLSNMEDTTPDTQSPKRGSVDQKQHPQLGDGVVGGTATGPRVNGKNVYVCTQYGLACGPAWGNNGRGWQAFNKDGGWSVAKRPCPNAGLGGVTSNHFSPTSRLPDKNLGTRVANHCNCVTRLDQIPIERKHTHCAMDGLGNYDPASATQSNGLLFRTPPTT